MPVVGHPSWLFNVPPHFGWTRYFSQLRMIMCKKVPDPGYASLEEMISTVFHPPGGAEGYLKRVSIGGLEFRVTDALDLSGGLRSLPVGRSILFSTATSSMYVVLQALGRTARTVENFFCLCVAAAVRAYDETGTGSVAYPPHNHVLR